MHHVSCGLDPRALLAVFLWKNDQRFPLTENEGARDFGAALGLSKKRPQVRRALAASEYPQRGSGGGRSPLSQQTVGAGFFGRTGIQTILGTRFSVTTMKESVSWPTAKSHAVAHLHRRRIPNH